jgi:hypothetical protein
MSNEGAAVVFWRASGEQRASSPGQWFSIGDCAPTLRADAPKSVPDAPQRAVVRSQAAITALHGWNRRDADYKPVHRARVLPDCVPAPQGQGKPPVAGLDRPADTKARRALSATLPKGGTRMPQQTQSHAVIVRELTRIGRPRKHAIHPGYAAIVAKAHALGLPQRSATDITIHDRLLIARRQPRQFAWLLHSSGSLLSLPKLNQRPLDYLHASRRLYSHALPFWWDGSDLMQTADIDQLIARMQASCAELHCTAEEL